MNKGFRLNPHTFVREFIDFTYMENQVSHTRAYLTGEDRNWMSGNNEELLHRLHSLWLIDMFELPMPLKRDFSYKYKSAVDEIFSNVQPFISEGTTVIRPWLNNLQIELTDVCNERCIHCYLPNTRKDQGRSLSYAQVNDLLQQYKEMGGLKVVFSGGEIFLHNNLFDILEICRSLNLMILLQSNLLTLRPFHIEKLKSLDIFNVQVSLYSSDRAIHESITGSKGSWEKTKKNIELLVENDIPVLISCPVMKQNLSTVPALKAYADSLNVDIYFDFIMMAQCDGNGDNLKVRLNLEDTRKMLQFIVASKPQYKKAIEESTSINDLLLKVFARRRMSCQILSDSICIDSDGTVYPCPGWNSMSLGNIRVMPLVEIWGKSEKAMSLRNIKSTDFAKCQACNLQNFCDMCAVYNYNENGDIFTVCNRFCESARLLRDVVIEQYNQMH